MMSCMPRYYSQHGLGAIHPLERTGGLDAAMATRLASDEAAFVNAILTADPKARFFEDTLACNLRDHMRGALR
ncbi:hypothetical protein MES4922_410033 [Mesorhizobium ventifaucium]|uniref:Uncharacterized protein n=1 Tax=Mesorhizobium ventifaucium TaxID=666020 RepID=A0ABM9EAV6_9HYPH|nr:hypothetical protein MES4922_410033 [Mesorhizobium ventifaucium]